MENTEATQYDFNIKLEDGMYIGLTIAGYIPHEARTNDYNDWLKVSCRFSFESILDYRISPSELMLSTELDELIKALETLCKTSEEMSEKIEFFEPDFEFKLDTFRLRSKLRRYLEWRVNLWYKGALSSNFFETTLDEEEINQLLGYLKSVRNNQTPRF